MAVDRRAGAFRVVILALIWFIVCVATGLVLVSSMPKKAHAQGGGFVWSERSSSAPHGRYVVMYNATGTTITDGTLVMVDTTGTTTTPQIALGKGFRTWSADPNDMYKVVGVLLGDVAGYQQGRVLVEGFHNHALLDSTACTAMSRLRPSLKTAGCLHVYTANPDSLNAEKKACAIFQRYATTSSLYAYVLVRMNWLGR